MFSGTLVGVTDLDSNPLRERDTLVTSKVARFESQISNHSAKLMNALGLTFVLFCTPSWLHIPYLYRSRFNPLPANVENMVSYK